MRKSKIIFLSILLALVSICIANNGKINRSDVNNQSIIKLCDNSEGNNGGDDTIPFCNLPPAR